MYAAGEQPKALVLTFPESMGKTEFFDLMSNPQALNDKGELVVTPLVTFFHSSLPPDALGAAFDGVQIHESPLPVERVWYGDFEGQ